MASWFERHRDVLTTPPRNFKKSRENKAKSFDESILIPQSSPRTFGSSSGYYYYSYTCTKEKKLHPLPLPNNLPLDSPYDFSTRSNSGSSSSTSSQYSNDELIPDKINWSRTNPIVWENVLDSPNGKQDKCIHDHPRHPLPLPPNSCTNNTEKSLESKWKKGRLLAKGTFSHVYAGFNSDSGQMCAIKEVRIMSNDITSKERLKQLTQEITLLSQFSHPNIVQYYGSELSGDKLSLYLEYVPGGSILKLLQQYGPFEEQIIRSYTRKIVSALVFLHHKNIAHRNIKGANILVNAKGEIKLADFGMAKHINSSLMTSSKGSPYWMAPEVVTDTGAGGYSVAVDIWSLGCTVLEMATAKPPWSQYERVAAISKLANSNDSPEIPKNLSNNAKSFVKLCLHQNPNCRSTAAQLLQHPFVQV